MLSSYINANRALSSYYACLVDGDFGNNPWGSWLEFRRYVETTLPVGFLPNFDDALWGVGEYELWQAMEDLADDTRKNDMPTAGEFFDYLAAEVEFSKVALIKEKKENVVGTATSKLKSYLFIGGIVLLGVLWVRR